MLETKVPVVLLSPSTCTRYHLVSLGDQSCLKWLRLRIAVHLELTLLR